MIRTIDWHKYHDKYGNKILNVNFQCCNWLYNSLKLIQLNYL